MIKLIDKTKQLIFAQQTSILSSTLLIASMVIVGRVFGFLRYRALAGYYTKEQLDIFFAAFRIPDLIFEVLITGALTASFIPFYIKYQQDKKKQDEYVSSIINLISLILFIFIAILTIFARPIMALLTPGFSAEKIDQITYFSQLLLIGQVPFMALGSFLTGISQAKKMFIIPAVAPIFYNLMVIVATLFFSQGLGLLAPVLGVIIGALLFFVLQLPTASFAQFNYRLIIKRAQELNDFFKIIVPRVFTIVIAQIDATVDLTLTSLLGSGAYTVFYFAQHLQLLPVAVIGISFGQASLPYLSEMHTQERREELRKVIVDSILNLFFLTVPIATFFIFARTPLVRIFFGGPKFDWDATVATAVTLSIFSLSVPFHSIYYFLTRCFYALFDSRTPFFISLGSLLLNILLSTYFILVLKLPVWSLAVSFSTGMIINVMILLVILYRKINGFDLKLLTVETFKIVVATFLSSIFVYYVLRLFDNLIIDTSRTINVIFLIFTMGLLYIVVYLFLAWVFNIKEVGLIIKMLLKVKAYQKKIVEIYSPMQ